MAGNLSSLEDGVQLGLEAVSLCPQEHPERARILQMAGKALYLKCERDRDLTSLIDAISRMRTALDLCPAESSARLSVLQDLGAALDMQFKLSVTDICVLEESVLVWREVHGLCSPGGADESRAVERLGTALSLMFSLSGNLDFLSESILLWQERLRMPFLDEPDHLHALRSLGDALFLKHDRTGSKSALAGAIRTWQSMLALPSLNPPDRKDILEDLSVAFSHQYGITGEIASFEESVQHAEEALNLCPLGDPNLEHDMGRLVSALQACMSLGEVVFESLSLHNRNRLATMKSFASAICLKCEMTRGLISLEKGISLWKEALEHCRNDLSSLPSVLSRLSAALSLRSDIMGSRELMAEINEIVQQALEMCPQGHPDHGIALQAVGDAYSVCSITPNTSHLSYSNKHNGVALADPREARKPSCAQRRARARGGRKRSGR